MYKFITIVAILLFYFADVDDLLPSSYAFIVFD